MRVFNSIKNIFWSIVSQLVVLCLGFISRKLLLNNLGIDYLGLNGLLSNIFSILSLVEGGLGISIVYNLYKPLAEKNEKKITSLVSYYKKIYIILALIIIVISVCIFPFVLTTVSSSSDIGNISLIYILYIAKLVLSYLYAHKWSLINADQKGYILTKMTMIFQIIMLIGRIVILYTTGNYIYYLILDLLVQIVQNIINSTIVSKLYPYINNTGNKKIEDVSYEVKQNIKQNVKALFWHNLGSVVINGTDNILVTRIIDLAMTGIYSNYTLIITSVSGLIGPFIGGLGASIGNLIASESNKKIYDTFKVVYFLNFLLYSTTSIILFNVMTPFITWYFGENLYLDNITLSLIIINYYTMGMTNSIYQFKSKAGIFSQDKYAPIIQSIINLVVSIYCGLKFGVAGIVFGTIVSTITVIFITQPYFVYKIVFKQPVRSYYLKYFVYFLTTFLGICISYIVCDNFVIFSGLLGIIFQGIICLIIYVIIIILLFHRCKEMEILINILKDQILKKIFIIKKLI